MKSFIRAICRAICSTGFQPVPGRALLAATITAAALTTPANGQDAAAQPAAAPPTKDKDDIRITVSDISRADKLIRVPAGKAVMVEFNVPVREVRVPKPDVAEVSAIAPTRILVTGKTFGATQLIAFVNDHDQRVFDIAVEIELDRLQASIRSVSPRANVHAYSVMNSIVLTGTVPDAESAQRIIDIAQLYSKEVINHMRVAGVQQVLLRCTVAEVNRRSMKQLGFNGWIGGDNVRDVFFMNNIGGINPSNIGAPGGVNVRSRIPFVTGQDGIPVTSNSTISFGFPRVQMQVFVQALHENGLLRVLAEPNLVTVNGQAASFLAGGEFPIPVPQGGQNNAITIEYREFGVRLQFTPTVLSENVIRMRVTPEVSEPDFSTAVTVGGFVVPGLIERRVDTVVELGSGQTFAIGGLLSERVRATSRKVPALGDIPVLGTLFSSTDYQADETELIVLVTPELVEPVNPDQLTMIPGSRYIKPNDWELYIMGQLAGQHPDFPPETLERPGAHWPVRPGELRGNGKAPGTRALLWPGSPSLVRGPAGLSSGDE